MSTAVQLAPGLWRTDLQGHDLGAPGRDVVEQGKPFLVVVE